jgi:hypothetical protein
MYMNIMYNWSVIWTSRSRNMEFRSIFITDLRFSVKSKDNTFGFSAEIWFFFKIHKILCIEPLCIIDLEYGLHDKEIWNFGQYLA